MFVDVTKVFKTINSTETNIHYSTIFITLEHLGLRFHPGKCKLTYIGKIAEQDYANLNMDNTGHELPMLRKNRRSKKH